VEVRIIDKKKIEIKISRKYLMVIYTAIYCLFPSVATCFAKMCMHLYMLAVLYL